MEALLVMNRCLPDDGFFVLAHRVVTLRSRKLTDAVQAMSRPLGLFRLNLVGFENKITNRLSGIRLPEELPKVVVLKMAEDPFHGG